ncbi:DUF559 domain-containing protein [Amycolatopsis alkalitolerans]|uniref:DUF559 domain-containing protein n=2 Tax=Amycolatopsis alkalitolerans TaxID=2547244 RepID=A0A5C4LSR5_9PSEU|nr:DUF559 domain-containing protein [Amycolatopsis alkalitolerans]
MAVRWGQSWYVFGIPNSEHGAARRRDVANALGERALRGALKDGVFVQLWRGIVVDGKRVLDPVTRASAALLLAGKDAVLSRNTAAVLHGLTAAEAFEVHVTVPYSSWVRSTTGLVVHHGRFTGEDVVTRYGLPVFSLDAVITELLCGEVRWKALACLDQALAGLSDRNTKALLDAVDLHLMHRDDRRGVRIAESLLALGVRGAESPQESRLRLVITDAGFPNPVTQHPIFTLSGELLYRLDLAWPELRIGVEYDGYEAHEGRDDYDSERDRRLAGRGWRIVRVRKEDLAEPARFLAELRLAFSERRYPLGA